MFFQSKSFSYTISPEQQQQQAVTQGIDGLFEDSIDLQFNYFLSLLSLDLFFIFCFSLYIQHH